MTHTVTLIPGDGVGREVAMASLPLFEAAGVDIAWEEVPAGRVAWDRYGDALPEETLASIRKNRVAIKGRLETPLGGGYQSPSAQLRKELDLFAALRPCRSLPGLPGRYEDVDLVVIRETTEDVYAGIEHEVVPGVVQTIKVTTAQACERVVRFAFRYAQKHGRKKVTLVHKANIMKRSDGLFIRVGTKVAEEFEGIEFATIIADNACMQMVRWPWQFDVMVAQNLFGDLISDLGGGLVGGKSAQWGLLRDDTDLHVYEAIHGVDSSLVGKGVANPLPFIRPATEMLRHLGEHEAWQRVNGAVSKTLEDGVRTRDLGGSAGTEAFVKAVIERL